MMGAPIRTLKCPCSKEGFKVTGTEHALRRLIQEYRGIACAHCGRIMTLKGDGGPVVFEFAPETNGQTIH